MSINYMHCLRPQFSSRLVPLLLDNTSVNVVISAMDKEAARLIEDIQRCQLANTRVLDVNMRHCRRNYTHFLAALGQAYHGKVEDCPDFAVILSKIARARQQFVIILNHFCVLEKDEVDKQFDDTFYEKLNSLKNYSHVALLIITRKPLDKIVFNIGGTPKTSPLDIQEVERLPPLCQEEVRHEVRQQALELSDTQIFHIIEQLKPDYDYGLLVYFFRQLGYGSPANDVPVFIKRLKSWKKEYKQDQGMPIAQKTRHWVDAIQRFFSYSHLPRPSLNLMKPLSELMGAVANLIKSFKNKE